MFSATFFLEQYALKDKTITVKQAIHQMTGVLAEGWGIKDRGLLNVSSPKSDDVFIEQSCFVLTNDTNRWGWRPI